MSFEEGDYSCSPESTTGSSEAKFREARIVGGVLELARSKIRRRRADFLAFSIITERRRI